MRKTTKMLALLMAAAMLLSLGCVSLASGEASGGGPGGTVDGTPVIQIENGAVSYGFEGDEAETAYTITAEPVITSEDGVTTIDGLGMTIHDFTACGVSVAGEDDTVYLTNAVIDKTVGYEITGTSGGFVAGNSAGTLYIIDSLLTEDGKGGTGGNYTAYSSGGTMVVENSSILQTGLDPNGYTADIGEPGSNGGLLVYGFARAGMSIGKSHTYYLRSYVETEGWAAMSTDAGTGVNMFSYLSTARAVNGGYGAYADNGCYDFIYGSQLLDAEMGLIIAGGGQISVFGSDAADDELLGYLTVGEPSAQNVRSLIVAARNDLMIHSPDESHSGDKGNSTASVFNASDTDFVTTYDLNSYWEANDFYDGTAWEPDFQDYGEKYDESVGEYIEFIRGACLLVKSTSADITLDNVTFDSMNDTILMTVINSDQNGRWVQTGQDCAAIQGTVANITNSTISGDFKNYDYQRKLTVNMDAVDWTGSTQTWDKQTFDAAWTDECKACDRCLWILDESAYVCDDTQGTVLTLANGSVWTVTAESRLASLTVDETSAINGVVTVDGAAVDVTGGGVWEGVIVVSPAQAVASAGVASDNPPERPADLTANEEPPGGFGGID